MKLGLVDADWCYIGAVLAQSNDIDQVNFFRSFVKECKSWGTNHQIGFQLATVGSQLSNEEKDVLSHLTYTDR